MCGNLSNSQAEREKYMYVYTVYVWMQMCVMFFSFSVPFTIQRLCELVTDPTRNYTGTEKFLRGVEKVRG